MRKKGDPLKGYKPLSWSEPSELTKEEQEIVEAQRKDLWRHGIHKEPMLTQMAFEFGATICSLRGTGRL